jgi:hypothetical protein
MRTKIEYSYKKSDAIQAHNKLFVFGRPLLCFCYNFICIYIVVNMRLAAFVLIRVELKKTLYVMYMYLLLRRITLRVYSMMRLKEVL